MTSIKIEAQNINCPVCQTTVVGFIRISKSIAAFIMKPTTCCGKLKAVHYKYPVKFSKIIDNTYKVDQKIYEGDQHIKLFCMNCSVNFFHCKNKRHNQFENLNVLVCETCKINW